MVYRLLRVKMSLHLLLKTAVLLSIVQYSKGDDCFFYFTAQPSSDTSCNPWPLLNSAIALPLHCHILTPKSNQLANVEWYKNCNAGSRVRVFPGGKNSKYSNPISSGDLIDVDFKFVNFSLVIHNISNSDAGCYWCEVSLKGGETCALDFQPSRQFCLLEESQYVNTSDCHTLALNEDKVCVANKRCDHNSQVNAQFGSHTITNTAAPSSSLTLSQQTTSALKEQDTSTRTTIVSVSPSLTKLISRHKTNSALKSRSQSVVVSGSQVISPSQQELRISLYIGIGVCCLLLVVILVLLAAVAVLCKVPGAKKQTKNVVDVSSTFPKPLSNVVWSRSNTSIMSIVNEGNVDFISSLSTPLASSRSAEQENGPHTNEAVLENNEEREIAIGGRESPTQLLRGARNHSQGAVRPDSHYYHVFEPPGCHWLASPKGSQNDENHHSFQKDDSCLGTIYQDQVRVRAAYIIEDEQNEYHWKATLPPTKGSVTAPPLKKKHEYVRLDCTKMNAKHKYTNTNIK